MSSSSLLYSCCIFWGVCPSLQVHTQVTRGRTRIWSCQTDAWDASLSPTNHIIYTFLSFLLSRAMHLFAESSWPRTWTGSLILTRARFAKFQRHYYYQCTGPSIECHLTWREWRTTPGPRNHLSECHLQDKGRWERNLRPPLPRSPQTAPPPRGRLYTLVPSADCTYRGDRSRVLASAHSQTRQMSLWLTGFAVSLPVSLRCCCSFHSPVVQRSARRTQHPLGKTACTWWWGGPDWSHLSTEMIKLATGHGSIPHWLSSCGPDLCFTLLKKSC